MKAIVYDRYGPPGVLRLEEVPAPVAKRGEVLIRVRAAEVTKADCELRAFRFPVKWFSLPLRLAWGVRRPRPARRILGGYLAGEIVAVGAGVEGFVVGDEVFGCCGLRMGAYGQVAALPATATLVHKPTTMTFAEAAAVPLGGLNALHFLRRARVESGDEVLIVGAGGSIGLHAIQIAKAMGARVTAVDKGQKEALVRGMGADAFVDYTREDFAARAERFDVAFDMTTTTPLGRTLSVLRSEGRLAVGNPRLSVMVRCLWTSWFSRRSATFAVAGETRRELEELRAMIEAGRVRSIVDEVLPMERVAEAHERVEAETRQGALMLALD